MIHYVCLQIQLIHTQDNDNKTKMILYYLNNFTWDVKYKIFDKNKENNLTMIILLMRSLFIIFENKLFPKLLNLFLSNNYVIKYSNTIILTNLKDFFNKPINKIWDDRLLHYEQVRNIIDHSKFINNIFDNKISIKILIKKWIKQISYR